MNFDCHLKSMKFRVWPKNSLLQRIQCPYSFTKSIKDLLTCRAHHTFQTRYPLWSAVRRSALQYDNPIQRTPLTRRAEGLYGIGPWNPLPVPNLQVQEKAKFPIVRFPPPIKVAPRYNRNIVEIGVKHHKPKPNRTFTNQIQRCIYKRNNLRNLR